MRVAGIIAEYNPFHAGHAWHIAQTRAAGATHVVAVMSGYTVQRGEFAIARKQARALAALQHGVDLVLCLPTPFSCARAQDFARAGVYLLQSLGCVDLLSFGSECGNALMIQRAESLLRQGEVLEAMRGRIGEGSSFAGARQEALAQADPQAAALLRSPNDTLGVEYLTAMRDLGAEFEVLAVPRRGAGHDEMGGDGPKSASELRIILQSRGVLFDSFSRQVLQDEIAQGLAPVDIQRLETAWMLRLRCMEPDQLAQLPDVSEGMEHLLYQAIRKGTTPEEIISHAVSRRYPAARIRRILFHALLGVTAGDFAGESALPCAIQVIGHNSAGREILRRAKRTAALPIHLRRQDVKALPRAAQRQYALECRAADLMTLAMPKPQPCGMEEKREVLALD